MRGLAFGIAAPVLPYSILLATFCLICRLAQEAPGLAFTTPVVASAAPVATLAPTTRAMAPAEEEVGPRRGDFTRLEYERRAQLKLMDDLDKVLRPRASGTGGPGRGGRRATRPRSGCCDDSALARSPARGLLGEDPVGGAL
jgi:calmodulin-regulated spectrin-associated protein